MLYDLASEPPTPGTLLESVFVLMAKRKQEAEYFKTKALVASNLAQSEEGVKLLNEALDEYRTRLFPFLAGEKQKVDKDTRKALKQWTNKVLKIRPMWRAHDHRGVVSKLRRGAERTRQAEELRRKHRHQRI